MCVWSNLMFCLLPIPGTQILKLRSILVVIEILVFQTSWKMNYLEMFCYYYLYHVTEWSHECLAWILRTSQGLRILLNLPIFGWIFDVWMFTHLFCLKISARQGSFFYKSVVFIFLLKSFNLCLQMSMKQLPPCYPEHKVLQFLETKRKLTLHCIRHNFIHSHILRAPIKAAIFVPFV